MVRRTRRELLGGTAAAVLMAAASPANALTSEEETIERARLTLRSMLQDETYAPLSNALRDARGVMVFPELFRGGFFVGGEGGIGVLLVRRTDGTWGYPAFYLMAGGSFGLQFGGQISEMVLAIMTQRGIDAVLSRYATLGADANAALVSIGVGVDARTALDTGADMYAFSRNQGLFAGISLEGSVITEESGRNEAYYGSGATARDILAGRRLNMDADPLRSLLPT